MRDYRLDEVRQFTSISRLLKKWEPTACIGQGSFAYVFRVVNKDGEEAALKYVPNPMNAVDSCVKGSESNQIHEYNFNVSQHEVKMIMRFRGDPCIVQYIDTPEFLKRTFRNAQGETVVQYAVLILMPLYQGKAEWVPQMRGSVAKRIQLGLDISKALSIFEKKEVYHRDVKPENILYGPDGHFYLSDVGEAKLIDEKTTVGKRGTPPYMAPEVFWLPQYGTHHSDHRSDIYSLGIVLYWLFNAEQFPFLASDGRLTEEASSIYKRYSHNLPANVTDGERAKILRYRGIRLPNPSEADENLSAVIIKACSYAKEDRYQTAVELYRDLEKYLETSGLRLAKESSEEKGTSSRSPYTSVRRTGLFIGVIAAAVVFCCWGSRLLNRKNRAVAPAPTATGAAIATAASTPATMLASEPTATTAPVPAQTDTPLPKLTATATPVITAHISATESPPDMLAENGVYELRGEAVGSTGNQIGAILTIDQDVVIQCIILDDEETLKMREGYDVAENVLAGKSVAEIRTMSRIDFLTLAKKEAQHSGRKLTNGGEDTDSACNAFLAVKNAVSR